MADKEENSRNAKLVASVRRQLVRRLDQVLVFLGVLALYLLLGVALWLLLDWYIDPSNAEVPSTAKKDLFQALGLMMAGVAGAIGVYFTWRNLNQTRQSTERTLWLTEQGQITERFTRAIEQLGATNDSGKPKVELRLGGIYALERIARDSPERDYSTVMEVLTAYVRENAPWPLRKSVEPTMIPEDDAEQQEDNEQMDPVSFQRPPADVKAIMDVLRRRKEERVPEERRAPLDLRRTNLYKADLIGANLGGATLYRANLDRAYLYGTYLYGTNLGGATLAEANLQYAILVGAILQGAQLQGAQLQGAQLQGAQLQGANLREAEQLTQAQLEQTRGDETTELPEGLHPPASWT
jgi:hypothetical protein